MSLDLFTLIPIVISLAGILSGLVVLGGWLAAKHYRGLTHFFLLTTALTSLSGFFFPFQGFTPAYAVGGISVVLLAIAAYAFYGRKLAGRWQAVYLITAATALYLNFFVLVAQLFAKTPALKALAPTQAEPAFGITQGLVLLGFAILGARAVRKFQRG
ncbi:MAG: hypothetical protein IAE97_06240 [Chthoniobacterales bacterium]|nr:hypothetical protein [Chthoniobacterales bacterium]